MACSRGIHSARQAAKRPEAKNGPRPTLPQTALRVRGRHAARDGKRSTGPLALQAATWAWAGKVSSRLG